MICLLFIIQFRDVERDCTYANLDALSRGGVGVGESCLVSWKVWRMLSFDTVV